MDETDYKIVRGLWWAAQIAGIWSGTGFALANTVAPDFVTMGIGVGIWVPILTGAAIAAEWSAR